MRAQAQARTRLYRNDSPARLGTRPMASNVQDNYQLSFEILGHSADVRAVRSFQVKGHAREHILTASRDGTACLWAPDPHSPNEYLLRKVLKKHTGYVSALCVIPEDLAAGRMTRKHPLNLLYLFTTQDNLYIRRQSLGVL